ncbi:hypothetical protein [Hoeflea prorocentri]|uniref:DUF1611 domain-containing protein n=1 Tax=Hoeflea prorocentri TaxID=1922333 RepID=A0A9X3UH23_9HYPH|nr:hypothetical protein [Hoeflea prorocentri]MCY6381197.1 hypothetical protein [Hoeflea prorocentri]MDA5398997.1 hypothetical protein [Hoeflea prorocentri]
MQILERHVVNAAKRAFSCRRVPTEKIKTLIKDRPGPRAGDLVLARVSRLGSHKRIELPSGRRAALLPGDEIIVVYGDRYAPDQYEAYVPKDLRPCHLVAAGGVASRAIAWHDRMGSGPTSIEPIGLLGCARAEPLNLADFAIDSARGAMPPAVFAVFGTSMNAGKTITAATLVKGFADAGYRVGAAKITGTAAGGDPWLMRDYGASEVLDFTDVGHASTFNIHPDRLFEGAENLLGTLSRRGCSVAVVEIADGLYQSETAALAQMEQLKSILTGTFFAAGDAMGAVSGASDLARYGHRVLGISGALTRSPLAAREAATASGFPVMGLNELLDRDAVMEWAGLAGMDLAAVAGQ